MVTKEKTEAETEETSTSSTEIAYEQKDSEGTVVAQFTKDEVVSTQFLSEKILQIYSEAPKGKRWTLDELAEITGADGFSVSVVWHSLFDQKLVVGTSFVKP